MLDRLDRLQETSIIFENYEILPIGAVIFPKFKIIARAFHTIRKYMKYIFHKLEKKIKIFIF